MYSEFSFREALLKSSLNLLLKGFVHSFLHSNYILQVSLLTALNLLDTVCVVRYKKCFEYCAYWILLLVYYLAFTILNVLFLFSYIDEEESVFNSEIIG